MSLILPILVLSLILGIASKRMSIRVWYLLIVGILLTLTAFWMQH
jgi:hypothetical protein